MVSLSLQDIRDIVNEAMAAEREGQPEFAYGIWDRITTSFTGDPAPLLQAADSLAAANELVLSEALLGHMVRIYPTHLIAAARWMERSLRRADWPETIRRSVLVRRRFPDSSFGYVLGGQALRESGRLAEADMMFGEAVSRFPADEGAMIHWADCPVRSGDFVEATRRYALARERFPRSSLGYVVGARVHGLAGQAERADALLCEAVERFSTDLRSHTDWTALATAGKDWPEAIRRAEITRSRFPGTAQAVMPLFQALVAMGRGDEADALIEQVADQFSGDATILISWAEAGIKSRNWPAALKRSDILRGRFPEQAIGHYFAAVALRESRRYAEAVALLEAPLQRFQSDVGLLREAAESMVALHRLKEAVAFLDRALTVRPHDAWLLQRRIQLTVNIGDYVDAMTTWRRLVGDKAANQKLCFDLAWTIFKAGPVNDDAFELLEYLVNEPDTGARDWLPLLAGLALLRSVRPELVSFAREALPRLEKGPSVTPTLWSLKSALLEDYSPQTVRDFIVRYVAGGRSALSTHLFSQTYIAAKPEVTAVFRTVFDDYIGQWLTTATPAQYQNFTEVLGYLTYAAVFSHDSYRRLVQACSQNIDIAALRADDTLRTPASAVGRIVALAGKGEAPLPNAPAIGRIRRLKIAVCVSGQLRGYEKAFPTWKRLGLEPHDTRYFVHTWKNIGRNWFRFWAFTQRREILWETLRRPDSFAVLETRYPTMTAACISSSTVTEAQLGEFYGTRFVCVEDDTVPPLDTKGTPWKMHSKIERVHQMARETGEDFDLYIRIRPDREVVEGSEPDWYTVFDRSNRERLLFSDRQLEYGVTKLTIGDQFAVGNTEVMDIYATTYSATETFVAKREIPLDLPAALDNHGSMAYRTLYNGILSDTVSDLKFGHLFDPVSLLPGDLVPFIEDDISARPNDEFDREFLAACREKRQ